MSAMPPSTPAAIEAWEVLDLLTALIQKSLVVYEEDEQGQGRYRLLETVRQYSRDRLLEAGEGAAVRGRHADFFLDLAERAEPELWSDAAWLDRLETEHDNLRAALQWCTGSRPEAALRLVGALWHFWDSRAYWGEALQELEGPLAGRANASVAVQWKALCAAGRMAAMLGDVEQASAWGEESLALCRQAGDRSGMGWSLLTLRRLAWARADLARAEALVREALAIFREAEDKRGTALALGELAESLESEGHINSALAVAEECLALCRQEGYRSFSTHALGMLGGSALSMGQVERAEALFTEVLAIRRDLGGRLGIGFALRSLAEVARSMKDFDRASTLYQETLVIWRELGRTWSQAHLLFDLASLAQAQGDRAQAWVLLEEARVIGQGSAAHRPNLAMSEGDLLLEMGEYTAARSYYEQALALRREQDRGSIGSALLCTGHAAWLQGDAATTEACAMEALGLFREQENKDGLLASLESLAAVALAQGAGTRDAGGERAARLVGAVEAAREALDLQGAPWWRRPRERIAEAARAVSAEPAFAAAWAAGRAMTLDQAISYALERERLPGV